MTAPIKTCDYCGATGEMPTFMNGETICYTCLHVLPKTLPEARQELMRLRAVPAVVAQPVPSVPEITIEMEHAFYEKVTVTRVGSIVGLAEGIKAAMLAAAPEAKP